MSQVYFDDATNEYFYYGEEDTADPGDIGQNNQDNNVSDNNIKPVPNATIKRGKNTSRPKQHIRKHNGTDEDTTRDKGRKNKSVRDVKSKHSGESESEEETESESESESSSSSGSSDSSSSGSSYSFSY